MEMKNPIGWVELPVTDLERAEKFYGDYFGFEFTRQPEHKGVIMSWFPMAMDSYGSGATLVHGREFSPSQDGVLVFFEAPEEGIAASVTKAEEQGITVLKPLTDIGEHGFMAFLQDSEGNRFGIHSMKE